VAALLGCGAVVAQPLSDPMRPPSEAAIADTTKASKRKVSQVYHLSAIRITKDQRSAMINGKIVKTGERIGDARLVEITANHVTLELEGRRITLSLLPVKIKKPAEAIQK
jgi:MSHA biogenesis protein MshK